MEIPDTRCAVPLPAKSYPAPIAWWGLREPGTLKTDNDQALRHAHLSDGVHGHALLLKHRILVDSGRMAGTAGVTAGKNAGPVRPLG